MSPKAGVPETRGFRVVGWKAERIGRGSQKNYCLAECWLL